MRSLVDIGEFAGQQGALPSGERIDWWPVEWVPIAEDGGGDLVCADGGGRVVVFHHDSERREVLAPSFGHWINTLADQMEAGRFYYDPDDWGLMEVEEE
jgi:cell wall assembly regulator SMI1